MGGLCSGVQRGPAHAARGRAHDHEVRLLDFATSPLDNAPYTSPRVPPPRPQTHALHRSTLSHLPFNTPCYFTSLSSAKREYDSHTTCPGPGHTAQAKSTFGSPRVPGT